MVLVATSILPHIPPSRRGFVSGMIFLGLGLGVAASGKLIPQLLHSGLRDTWIGLGVLSLVMTGLSWFGWPASNPPAPQAAQTQNTTSGSLELRVLYAQYAANALGLVPVIVLLVDYVARGLGRGAAVGADYWVLYGLAAIAGPIICGKLGDRIGFGAAWRAGLALQAVAVTVLAITANPLLLAAATVILGVFTPGIVPLVLGRINEMVPHDHVEQCAAWSRATTAFALFQALGGYGDSYLFSRLHNDYAAVFLCGTGALTLAFAADLFMLIRRTRHAGR